MSGVDLPTLVVTISGKTTIDGGSVGFGLTDAGVFFEKLRRDFFVGVIFSAAGEVECANSIVSSSVNSADLAIVVAIFSGTTTIGGGADLRWQMKVPTLQNCAVTSLSE